MSKPTPFVIAISGKIGAGKNYLATKLTDELIRCGFTVTETSFAKPLKDELTTIIEKVHPLAHHETLQNRLEGFITKKAESLNLTPEQLRTIIAYLKPDLEQYEVGSLTGQTKTEHVRRALQYLGTDVRRTADEDYWVNLFANNLPDTDVVIVPDARFPNEALTAQALGGVAFRIEIPLKVAVARASKRDGIQYTEEALNHSSETRLDNFGNFDFLVGEKFDTPKLVATLEPLIRALRDSSK